MNDQKCLETLCVGDGVWVVYRSGTKQLARVEKILKLHFVEGDLKFSRVHGWEAGEWGSASLAEDTPALRREVQTAQRRRQLLAIIAQAAFETWSNEELEAVAGGIAARNKRLQAIDTDTEK